MSRAQRNADRAREISPKSVRNCIGIVSSMFRLAVLEGAVEVNPVSQTPRDGLPSMGSRAGQPTPVTKSWRSSWTPGSAATCR